MPSKDTYIQTSREEYSDYCIESTYYVLKDFCFIEQLKIYLVIEGKMPSEGIKWDSDGKGFRFKAYTGESTSRDYFNWLVKLNFLKPIEVTEYHTGSYGTFEMNLP